MSLVRGIKKTSDLLVQRSGTWGLSLVAWIQILLVSGFKKIVRGGAAGCVCVLGVGSGVELCYW